MDDLISREAAIEALKRAEALSWAFGYHNVIGTIREQPTIDAVEVVRCKDCKHWHREIHDGIEYFNFSSCDLNHCGDGHNFYCADGERGEE